MYGQAENGNRTVPNKRFYQFVFAVFLFGAIYWFGLRTDPKVNALNQAIYQMGSPALQAYPYSFRVVRVDGLDGEMAVMETPRSSSVPVYRMIGAIYPRLSGRSPMDPDFVAAEKELAQIQGEAHQIILSQHGVASVKWELDQNWLLAHNIPLN
jgi:hypothetical protein